MRLEISDIPAARYNAVAEAIQLGRRSLPFSVRQGAVLAAEAVAVAWEENHAKWCALHDEIDLLKGIIRELHGAKLAATNPTWCPRCRVLVWQWAHADWDYWCAICGMDPHVEGPARPAPDIVGMASVINEMSR